MNLLILALCFSGFVALCMSMERYQAVLPSARIDGPRLRGLRWLGWALTAAALACAVSASGWGVGVVRWLAAMTIAGSAITFGLLPYRPHWIKPGAFVLPLLAAILLWVH